MSEMPRSFRFVALHTQGDNWAQITLADDSGDDATVRLRITYHNAVEPQVIAKRLHFISEVSRLPVLPYIIPGYGASIYHHYKEMRCTVGL